MCRLRLNFSGVAAFIETSSEALAPCRAFRRGTACERSERAQYETTSQCLMSERTCQTQDTLLSQRQRQDAMAAMAVVWLQGLAAVAAAAAAA